MLYMCEVSPMFNITGNDVEAILRDYGIIHGINGITELQRYNYERKDPASKEVRLIVKIALDNGAPLVMRFKNETDVTIELIESQSRFANLLKENGVITPEQHMANGRYANWYNIGGYDVIVTVEEFVENEVKLVDSAIARKTGALLARTHAIAEQYDIHVKNDVLFDPFAHNDLFAFDAFMSLENALDGEGKALFDRIVDKYNEYMEVLAPLKSQPRYAVQGDISDCNLYLTAEGDVGIFDFNRAGDNVLFCDAIMQAIFEARLMDYPEDSTEDFESQILNAFLDGYRSVRSFTQEERELFPYLFRIVDAFWSFDMLWREDGLMNSHKAGDSEAVMNWLKVIWERITGDVKYAI